MVVLLVFAGGAGGAGTFVCGATGGGGAGARLVVVVVVVVVTGGATTFELAVLVEVVTFATGPELAEGDSAPWLLITAMSRTAPATPAAIQPGLATLLIPTPLADTLTRLTCGGTETGGTGKTI